MANRKLCKLSGTGNSMASPVARIWIVVASLLFVVALGWWFSPSNAHAQELPTNVYAGTVNIDGNPAPDGTTITAWIEGNVVGKTTAERGGYSLSVVQPQGQS